MNADQLRDIVRAEVVKALEAAKAKAAPSIGGAPRLIVIPDASAAVDAAFAPQVESLRKAGHAVATAGTGETIDTLVIGASAGLLPGVSEGTAAKIAHGIQDDLVSSLVPRLLEQGVPVIAAAALDDLSRRLREQHPKAPPALLRLREQNLHLMHQCGVEFVPAAALAATVTARLIVPVNETPERLARTKPSPKREFVTGDDVWKVHHRGSKVLTHGRNAYVTDEAREQAARLGIELRAD